MKTARRSQPIQRTACGLETRRGRRTPGKIFLLSLGTFFIASSVILAAFSLIHAWHDHDSGCEGDACPLCARIASAHGVFRHLDTAARFAVFPFYAVYIALHNFKPACPRKDLHTLIALKIQLNR
jgi:hypothetical protein